MIFPSAIKFYNPSIIFISAYLNIITSNRKPIQLKTDRLICHLCRRWESNPHGRKAHYALNVARLPVPPLRQ